MDLVFEAVTAMWDVLVASGAYLLLGFVVAGLLKVLLPHDLVFRHLGREDLRSVGIAAAAGAPLPLCSCSVVPTAVELQRRGASKGATTSFLIATPETGVDSIGVTWALMDPVMTVARPVAAVVTAVVSGGLVSALERRSPSAGPAATTDLAPDRVATAPADPSAAPTAGLAPTVTAAPAADADLSCCADAADEACADTLLNTEPRPESWPARLGAAVRYAFGPLMADLAPWFVVGFVLAALITVLVPEDGVGEILPAGWMSMAAMLAVGIPTYVCATASTPIAAALVAKGLDPGAALVLLLAGPATNAATIMIVARFLGRRVLGVYLASIAAVALLLGALVNVVYGALDLDASARAAAAACEPHGLVENLAGGVLAVVLAYHLVVAFARRRRTGAAAAD